MTRKNREIKETCDASIDLSLTQIWMDGMVKGVDTFVRHHPFVHPCSSHTASFLGLAPTSVVDVPVGDCIIDP